MPKARISQNGSFVCGSAAERVFGGLPRSRSGEAGKPCGGARGAQSHLPGALAGRGWGDTQGVFAKPISCWKLTGSLMNSVLEITPFKDVLGIARSRVGSSGSEQVEREGATSDPSQPLLLCRVWQAAQSKGQGRGVSTTDPLQRCLLKMNGI